MSLISQIPGGDVLDRMISNLVSEGVSAGKGLLGMRGNKRRKTGEFVPTADLWVIQILPPQVPAQREAGRGLLFISGDLVEGGVLAIDAMELLPVQGIKDDEAIRFKSPNGEVELEARLSDDGNKMRGWGRLPGEDRQLTLIGERKGEVPTLIPAVDLFEATLRGFTGVSFLPKPKPSTAMIQPYREGDPTPNDPDLNIVQRGWYIVRSNPVKSAAAVAAFIALGLGLTS